MCKRRDKTLVFGFIDGYARCLYRPNATSNARTAPSIHRVIEYSTQHSIARSAGEEKKTETRSPTVFFSRVSPTTSCQPIEMISQYSTRTNSGGVSTISTENQIAWVVIRDGMRCVSKLAAWTGGLFYPFSVQTRGFSNSRSLVRSPIVRVRAPNFSRIFSRTAARRGDDRSNV